MQVISHYQVRKVPGAVKRVVIEGRKVDFWAPPRPTHLLIAHDGQNVFDPRTATRRSTWRMAQNAIKVFEDRGLTPPAIIGVFHSSSKDDIHGRAKDLSPQSAFEGGVKPLITTDLKIEDLHGDWYQQLIAEKIVPTICDYLNFEAAFENSAMIGSSMGGLATLNALTLRPHFFRTALAFSPHWVLGGQPLVRHVLEQLPKPGAHKIWMSRGDRKLDSTYKPDQDFADRLMREQGWRNNYRSTVFKGAGHNERAWAKQVDDAFRFWLLD